MNRELSKCRGVAQPGSAPALGAGGRVFESHRPDHLSHQLKYARLLLAAKPMHYTPMKRNVFAAPLLLHTFSSIPKYDDK
jgi:hypothetical protein